METKNSQIQSLQLFNEKGEKLLSSNFVKSIKNNGLKFKLSWDHEKGGSALRQGPQGEDVDSFVLTFRFFIQDNESSSFRNLSKVYENSAISSDLQKDFVRLRKLLNDLLNSKSRLKWNEIELTKREVQDIFIYGGLAHANQEKRETFSSWQKNLFFFTVAEHEFVETMFLILHIIKDTIAVNQKAIEEISSFHEF